jgi:hypothetical protein
MPGEDGGGLHDDEAGAPVGPEAGQPDPEDPVPSRQMGSDHGSLEDEELMTEGEVLEGDGRRPKEPGTQEGPETDHDNHCGTPASGVVSEPRLYRINDGGGGVSSGSTAR